MKRLIILRHAKAVGKNTADDFGRVLAPRGRAEMKAVSRYVAERSVHAELALVSPAARTRETWSLAGFHDVPARFVEDIYEAFVDDLLGIVRKVEDEVGSVVLVGHNSGLEELAICLSADSGPLRSGLPTAAFLSLELPVESWREVQPGQGRVEWFETPATLGAGQDA